MNKIKIMIVYKNSLCLDNVLKKRQIFQRIGQKHEFININNNQDIYKQRIQEDMQNNKSISRTSNKNNNLKRLNGNKNSNNNSSLIQVKLNPNMLKQSEDLLIFPVNSTCKLDNNNQNYLYNDAIQREMKKKIIDKMISEETKRRKNTSKIDSQSQKIIFRKLEEYLQILISSIEAEKGFLTFEGIGFFFQQLGVFQSLKFQIDGNGVIILCEIFEQLSKSDIKLLKKEMSFHEQIWRLMCIKQLNVDESGKLGIEEIEFVRSRLLFDISLVLLEIKLTSTQTEILMKEIISTTLFNGDENQAQKALNQYLLIESNWSFGEIVKQFRQLFIDKTILMNLYTNWNRGGTVKKEDCPSEDFGSSFQPIINEKSRLIDQQSQGFSTNLSQFRHEQLFQNHKDRLQRKQISEKEKQKKEMDSCTFKPTINNKRKDQRPSFVINKESQIINLNNEKDNEPQIMKKCERYEQLYQIHDRKQQELKEIQENMEFNRHEQDLNSCTFKPLTGKGINPAILKQGNIQSTVKGFKQQLERMDKARREKEDRNTFFEKKQASLVEFNQKYSAKIIPFSFHSYKQQTPAKLIGHIDVNISKTKKGKIYIREGDDPTELANEFQKIYSISNEMTLTLAEILKQYTLKIQNLEK